MFTTRRVNRPVFRVSKPGENVHWTTRDNPQVEAIRYRKEQLATPPPELPTELPEKEAEEGENDPDYLSQMHESMKGESFDDELDMLRARLLRKQLK